MSLLRKSKLAKHENNFRSLNFSALNPTGVTGPPVGYSSVICWEKNIIIIINTCKWCNPVTFTRDTYTLYYPVSDLQVARYLTYLRVRHVWRAAGGALIFIADSHCCSARIISFIRVSEHPFIAKSIVRCVYSLYCDCASVVLQRRCRVLAVSVES